MWVEDGRESECRFVMKRIRVETLSYTKVGRLLRKVILYKKLLELFKVEKQMNEIRKSCASTDHIQNDWDGIDWLKCEVEVQKLQARIVKAQKDGKHNKVKSLQWILTHSFYAKALAVKRVTSNQGGKTAGVDKVLWSTSKAKMKGIFELKRRGYNPQPLKRVNIKKSNGKLRPLGVPTMRDRAMQALHLMALDPIAETIADNHSYGFRKKRSTEDAMSHIFLAMSKRDAPQWILEADIKGCFDHISHEWMLKNIPTDKYILDKWLKSGYLFKGTLFPTAEGTPQGGIISPTLANLTLDGIQELVNLKRRTVNGERISPMTNLIRYADDFVITGRSKKILEEEVIPKLKEFLKVRGLTLSEEKTKITHINDGFDFVGFNFRKYNGKLLIKPTKEGMKRLTEKVADIINRNKTVQQITLIRLLNPVITGWGNYYDSAVSAKSFQKLDKIIFDKLWKWSLRRHPKKGKDWIKNKYFHTVNGRKWQFGVKSKSSKGDYIFTLKRLSDFKITRHIKLKADANPYDNEWSKYFADRKYNKMRVKFLWSKTLIELWSKQKHLCFACGKRIEESDTWNIVKTDNDTKVMTHKRCNYQTKLNWKY